MKDEPVVLGGEFMDKCYGDFQEQMDMLNQAFAEVMMEGDAEERVFTFPIPTYNITREFEWDNPAYDKIWEMTARYGIPALPIILTPTWTLKMPAACAAAYALTTAN